MVVVVVAAVHAMRTTSMITNIATTFQMMVQDERKVMQPILKYLLMFEIQYNLIWVNKHAILL
jgi:hypothetical protein